MGIVDDYINETNKYKLSHGDKTVVLMQCGSFFEIYGLKDKHGNITGSDLVKIAEICELNIAHKKICVQGKNVMFLRQNGTKRLGKKRWKKLRME